MSDLVKLVLPYPPSANRYWRVFNGRATKSPEARAYLAQVKLLFRRLVPLEGDVMVRLDVFRPAKRGDLDKSIKVLLDALQGVAYLDDQQVTRILAVRHDDKARPRVEVQVHSLAWLAEYGDVGGAPRSDVEVDPSDYERPRR